MRFYACPTCKTSYQLAGTLEELHSMSELVERESAHCPTPLCEGRVMQVKGHARGFTQKEIPLQTFYRAVHGFGAPDGSAATVNRFRELITTKKVMEVHAEPTGQPERVILKRLVMEDGTRLHFDSSSKGACCYYIEEPGPSCLEVFDEQHRGESADTDRKKAGRVVEARTASCVPVRGGSATQATASERPESGGVPAVPATSDVPKSDRPADGNTGPGADVRV